MDIDRIKGSLKQLSGSVKEAAGSDARGSPIDRHRLRLRTRKINLK